MRSSVILVIEVCSVFKKQTVSLNLQDENELTVVDNLLDVLLN